MPVGAAVHPVGGGPGGRDRTGGVGSDRTQASARPWLALDLGGEVVAGVYEQLALAPAGTAFGCLAVTRSCASISIALRGRSLAPQLVAPRSPNPPACRCTLPVIHCTKTWYDNRSGTGRASQNRYVKLMGSDTSERVAASNWTRRRFRS